MHNSNSFIMRDQVGDVVKSVMEDEKRFFLFRYLSPLSVIGFTLITIVL